MKRTFLLGAGFSKAVADGPLMDELWVYLNCEYEREKKRDLSLVGGNNRIGWYEDIRNFNEFFYTELDKFEEEFCKIDLKNIKNNIEFLFTYIEFKLNETKVCYDNINTGFPPHVLARLNPSCNVGLKEIKSNLLTYLCLVMNRLKGSYLVEKFVNKLTMEYLDVITFNYDLILEQALWRKGIWSPLGGYIGVSEFERQCDKNKIEEAGKNSNIKIHKMHGSINWIGPEFKSNLNNSIKIGMDNYENWGFYFEGSEKILCREPVSASSVDKGIINEGYAGRHTPEWILPSFIKTLERNEFKIIWESAKDVLSKTDELIIVGYSFRKEDSASYELLKKYLNNKANVVLIDPDKNRDVRKQLKEMGIFIREINHYDSLEKYLKT
jgi:hypothetical protein